MSEESTPQADGSTQFFRDAPLWLSGFVLFLFMRGMIGFWDDMEAAWGSRGIAWFLVHIVFGVVVGVVTAWYIRARSHSRRATTPPSAV